MRKNSVFIISLAMSLIVATVALVFSDGFAKFSSYLFDKIANNFSWLYLLAMLVFVFFIFGIAISKYGNIKLGKENERPEYSTFSWFAMLFCAGMGVGLVFWGISEPLSHYIAPSAEIASASPESAEFAIKSSFMHWGVHAWACYAVIALPLAYMQFRKGKPGLISSILIPLYGEKNANGWIGKVVDILASFATIAGIVTSLGLGVLQIGSGLEKLLGIPNTYISQIVIILVVTVIFIISATSGIGKGVKLLSSINVYIALIIMIFLFIVGHKIEILDNMITGVENYITDFMHDSLALNPYADSSWTVKWKIFYWAWWIAWAPFSGAFIARISKGRTIREFIFGVVFAPTLAAIVWFSIFGSLGLHLAQTGILTPQIISSIAANPETGIFIVLSYYPMGRFVSIVACVLLLCFFITSADSGTFVLASFSSNGVLEPPNSKKIIWGITQAVLAIGLLLAGGLKPLQTISIVAAFPFVFIMLAACISLIKALRNEKR